MGVVKLLLLVDGKAERLADSEEVLDALGPDLIELGAVAAGKKENLAVGVGVLGEPFGLLDIARAADDTVVLHEDHVRLFGHLSDVRCDLVRSGRSVRSERNLIEENVGLGIDAVRRNLTREKKRVAVRRMAMDAGVPAGGLHHRDVNLNLARARTVAAELPRVHIDEADILFLHKALAAQRGRTENEILADADGEIAAVAVGKAARVNAATHLAHIGLDLADCGRVEELVELLARFRLGTVFPVVGAVDERGIDVKFFVHFY